MCQQLRISHECSYQARWFIAVLTPLRAPKKGLASVAGRIGEG
jgi:hypothetical protein